MVNTNIYSGKVARGLILDSFEYANYGDDLTTINSYLANEWAVTLGALTVEISPNEDDINLGSRTRRVMHITGISNGETITRTLPGSISSLQRGKATDRYLAIRACRAPGNSLTTQIRPIVVNDDSPEEYAAADTPATLTDEMVTYLFKLGPTGGEFNTDRDQAGGTGGNHTDYGSWTSGEQLKKVAIRFEISGGTGAAVYVDDIYVIDQDNVMAVEFHYDTLGLSAPFEYQEMDTSGGHGSYTRPDKSLPMEVSLTGVVLDDEADILGWFLKLRNRFAAYLALFSGSDFDKWTLFLVLEDMVMPVNILSVDYDWNRISYTMAAIRMDFMENTNMVVLD